MEETQAIRTIDALAEQGESSSSGAEMSSSSSVAESTPGDTGQAVMQFTDEQFGELMEAVIGGAGEETEDGGAGDEEKEPEEPDVTEQTLSSILENVERIAAEPEETEAEAVTEVPEGFYEAIADLESQQTFYQSLILGMLLFIIFSSSFKR